MIGRTLGVVALSLGLLGCAEDTVIVHDSQTLTERINTDRTYAIQAYTGKPGQGYVVMCRVDTVTEYQVFFTDVIGFCHDHMTLHFGIYSAAFSAPDVRMKLKSGEVVKILDLVDSSQKPPTPGYYAMVAIRRGPYDIEFLEGEQPAYWIEPGKFNVLGRFDGLTPTRDRAIPAISGGMIESFDYIDASMMEQRPTGTATLSCIKEQFNTLTRDCTVSFDKNTPFFRTGT